MLESTAVQLMLQRVQQEQMAQAQLRRWHGASGHAHDGAEGPAARAGGHVDERGGRVPRGVDVLRSDGPRGKRKPNLDPDPDPSAEE